MRSLAITSRSPEETRILGASLAPVLLPGDVISLNGDLGAGKTVFVQGLATALGTTRRVTSPAFTIVHEYDARWPILHIDVYRLSSYQEVIDLGFEELIDPGAILIVEWGEAVAPLLPPRFLEIVMRRSPDPGGDAVAQDPRDRHGSAEGRTAVAFGSGGDSADDRGVVQSDEERVITFRPRGGEWPRKLEAMRVTAETLLDAASPELSTESRFVDAGEAGARDHMKPEDVGE